MWPRFQGPPSGWKAAVMRWWVCSITSGCVIERLKTCTGLIRFSSSCNAGSCEPTTGTHSSRRHSCGTTLISSKTKRSANSIRSGAGPPCCSLQAACTRAQSSSLRKSSRPSADPGESSERITSPRSSRRKTCAASRKTRPFSAGQAAASTGSRASTP